MESKNTYSPLKQGVLQFESTRFMWPQCDDGLSCFLLEL